MFIVLGGLSMTALLLIWAVFGIVSAIDRRQQRKQYAAAHRACPHCAEFVKREALVCKHCHRDLPKLALAFDWDRELRKAAAIKKQVRLGH